MRALSQTTEPLPSPAPAWRQIAPVCLLVFLQFTAIGLPLAVLPGHVDGHLGFGTFIVGLVMGAHAWATLLTRHAAGTRSDHRGPRTAALTGLAISGVAGVICAASGLLGAPTASLLVLLAGRGLLGFGESFVVTGALAWAVALAGRERSGLVMAWIGIAMYGALAAGAPLGSALAARVGFGGMSLVAAMLPLAAIAVALGVRPVPPVGGTRLPLSRVARLVWLPGAGLSMGALGFGAIAAFSTLHFRERGWPYAALAMTAFGAAYVLARVAFGGLPDRFGGARVALASALVTALGQTVMWLATSPTMAVAAAAVTGFGFSLAFPAFGVEAIRRVPPQNRGVALGAYAAAFDATIAVGVPGLGVIVGAFSHRAAFAVGACAALGSFAVALVLASRSALGPRA